MNLKAKAVIKRLREKNKTFNIKLLGDRENELDAFAIMVESNKQFSEDEGIYKGLTKKTIALLKEAEIKFEVVG